MNAVAAFATNGGTLFLMYMPSSTNMTLLTLSPSGSGPMKALAHTIDPSSSVKLPKGISGASMVSSATLNVTTGAYQYHLFLAINKGTQPYMFRLDPQLPNTGDGQELNMRSPTAPMWSITDQSQILNFTSNVTRAWCTSGRIKSIASSPGVVPVEGSAMYVMANSGNATVIQMLDVSVQISGVNTLSYWPIVYRYVKNQEGPKFVRLPDDSSGKGYQAFLIGSCMNGPGTCIILMDNENGQATPMATNMTYDPTSCVAAISGSIVIAQPSGIWTLPYTNQTAAAWVVCGHSRCLEYTIDLLGRLDEY
ncbi:hypothetical protein B0O80DRAFT_234366 [Mortierella sp. GBAus27b]|nr:hypothetical protein B0O80DRAFT_234366 [Mortierella sp. GBAus27b]